VKVASPESKVQSPKSNDLCASRLARCGTAASRSPLGLWTRDFGLWSLAAALWLLAPAFPLLAADPISPDDIPPLRPPHAELAPTFWEQHGLWVVILGVLLLALICAVVWLLTRPKPPVVVPPEVQARQALEPLGRQPEDGALLSRVSQILRHFVTAAFALPPGELTTTEFCRAIAGHEQIGPELATALREFLRQCDQRKFSPVAPAAPFSATTQALKLIDQAQAHRTALAQSAAQPNQSPITTPPNTGMKQ
jgi:hypothetical protein